MSNLTNSLFHYLDYPGHNSKKLLHLFSTLTVDRPNLMFHEQFMIGEVYMYMRYLVWYPVIASAYSCIFACKWCPFFSKFPSAVLLEKRERKQNKKEKWWVQVCVNFQLNYTGWVRQVIRGNSAYFSSFLLLSGLLPKNGELLQARKRNTAMSGYRFGVANWKKWNVVEGQDKKGSGGG